VKAEEVEDNAESGKPLYLVATFTNPGLEIVKPAAIIKELVEMFQLPSDLRAMVCWKCTENMKGLLYNPKMSFTGFSMDEVIDRLVKHECMCSKLVDIDAKYKDAKVLDKQQHPGEPYRHVFTTDMSMLPGKIGSETSKGLNHIPARKVSVRATLSETKDLVLRYLQAAVDRGLLASDHMVFTHYEGVVEDLVTQRLSPLHKLEDDEESVFHEADIATLKNLKAHLYICELDKAKNNAHIRCVDLARFQAYKRLESAEDFVPIPYPSELVVAELTDRLQDLVPELPTGPPGLPYFFDYYKDHKDKHRNIVNGSNCITSPIGQLSQVVMKEVQSTLQEVCKGAQIDLQRFYGIDMTAYPCILEYREVLANLPDLISSDRSFDVECCFERIPIDTADPDGLPTRLHWCCKEVWAWYQRTHAGKVPSIYVRLDPATKLPVTAVLTHTQPLWRHMIVLDLDRVKAVNECCIATAYVTLGDRTYRQVSGIAMGAAPSPQYCELYLSSYELSLCRKLASGKVMGGLDVLRGLKFWYRQMDDLRFVNCHKVDYIMSDVGLYPSCLNLKETSERPEDVPDGFVSSTVFLDIRTDARADGTFDMSRHWKEDVLPFCPIKFMQYDSNRPSPMKDNMILGMTLSSMYHSSSAEIFMADLKKIVDKMVANGFSCDKLMTAARKFATARQAMPFLPFDVSKMFWRRTRCKKF
jgi:hypothetical protein